MKTSLETGAWPIDMMNGFKEKYTENQSHFTPDIATNALAFALLLITGVFFPSCSRYQQLYSELNAYRPPAIASSAGHSVQSPMTDSQANIDFNEQKAQLEQMGKRWESALSAPEADTWYFSPERKRLSELEMTRNDRDAAARALSSGFSLETLEILTLIRNPGIRSAEEAFRGSLEAYSQVSNLDEILRQYAAFTQAVMTGIGAMADTQSPAMKFPFPGVMALKGEIVQQEVTIARESLEIARKSAITEARKLFWNLTFNRHAQQITASTLSALDQFELSARKRYEVGKESMQEVIRVQIQQEKLREEQKTLQEEQKNLQVEIRKMVDLTTGSDIGFPAFQEPRRQTPAIENLYDIALKHNQNLRTIRATIARMERMIELAETEIYPGFTQNLSLFENNAFNQVGSIRTQPSFADGISASTGEGLPKNAWFGLGDAYLRETRKKFEALKSELKNAENITRSNAREAWFKLDRAIREERLYTNTIRELSRLSAEVLGMRYESGVVQMGDVIDSYLIALDARLTSERKKSEIEIAWADLESIVGISF